MIIKIPFTGLKLELRLLKKSTPSSNDLMDTFQKVLQRIGFTAEMAEAAPSNKVSDSIAMLMEEKMLAVVEWYQDVNIKGLQMAMAQAEKNGENHLYLKAVIDALQTIDMQALVDQHMQEGHTGIDLTVE